MEFPNPVTAAKWLKDQGVPLNLTVRFIHAVMKLGAQYYCREHNLPYKPL